MKGSAKTNAIAATSASIFLAVLATPVLADPPGAPDYSVKPKTRTVIGGQRALASPAICSSFKSHRKFLAARYGEHPVFSGEAAPGIQMRLFANTTTGSWTMLLVRRNGYSCVRGAGKRFRHDVGT